MCKGITGFLSDALTYGHIGIILVLAHCALVILVVSITMPALQAGRTPLHWAAISDNEPAVSCLARFSADVNAVDKVGGISSSFTLCQR